MATVELDVDIPLGQRWMNKGQREWQAWTDERHAQFNYKSNPYFNTEQLKRLQETTWLGIREDLSNHHFQKSQYRKAISIPRLHRE